MKALTYITILALAVFSGCNQGDRHEGDAHAVEEMHHNHGDAKLALRLNKGEKWKVNQEMRPYVMKAEELLENYRQDPSTGYVKLAESLKEQNDLVISNCAMEGESHDELHKWLYPHMKLVEALNKSTNTEDANKVISEIEASFDTYHRFFE